MAEPGRPQGKVRRLEGPPPRFQPLLVVEKRVLPLGEDHTSEAEAEAAYDVAKLLVRALAAGGGSRGGGGLP